MIVSNSPPLQRVHEILQRMQTDTDNVECLKTCCGALAILAKDEANKLLIARDGTRLILTVMEGHATRPDLQEAVCDLLWSLAFNNGLVKEVVGRQGGIALILKGMSSHLSSPELVKSACGALSNMCQNTYNQNLIAAHGGVRTILSALQSHRMNAPLLPFVFDALASLIVGNQRNGLLVSAGGGIRGVLTTMGLHSGRREVVKSGCHALAILSDIQGQGARIAGADGVKVLLPALRANVRFLHLHRIAAIVLLRMLQEASVARDIASHGGVVIMLGMLREHAREEETVAATVHILYLITHADVMRGGIEVEVGRHFSGIPPPNPLPERGSKGADIMPTNARGCVSGSSGGGGGAGNGNGSHGSSGSGNGSMNGGQGSGVDCSSITDRELFSTSSVGALVLVLQAHMERKDIVRAAMRSAANLIRVRSVVRALVSEAAALPTVLQCLALHTTSRGITDSAVVVAGALLAAAHEGGSSHGFKGPTGKVGTDSSNVGGTGGNFKLSALSSTSDSIIVHGRGQHHSTPRQQHPILRQHHFPEPHVFNGTGNPPISTSFSLRFAYAPLQDTRPGATVETGLRGQSGNVMVATTMTPSTNVNTKVAKSGGFADDGTGGGRGTRGGEGLATSGVAGAAIPATPATTAQAVASRSTIGDEGGWSASMQALCAMLRARRRDPALAGLVFLALTACITEWSHACDMAGQLDQHQPSRSIIASRGGVWRGCSSGVVETVPFLRGNTVSSSALHRYQPSATVASAVAAAAAGGLERSSLHGTVGKIFAGVNSNGSTESTKSPPRAKMHLGIREALKAGLVWAEAIPLYRCRAMEDDRRGFGYGGGGEDAGVEGSQSPAAVEVSFNPAMAEAVERLCRLLGRGFIEMGFGRAENATPLGEAVSLAAFDANVPEVLENLRAARQSRNSRECIESLMRTFLSDELPESPTVDPQDATPVAAEFAAKNATALKSEQISIPLSARSKAVHDCRSGGWGKSFDDNTIGTRGVNPFPSRRSSSGKMAVATPGSINIGMTNSENGGQVASPGGSGGADDAENFLDEAGADGTGLLTSSPGELEPILPPSATILANSTTLDMVAATEFPVVVAATAAAATKATAAVTATGSGGGSAGAYSPLGPGMPPSRYSAGVSTSGAIGTCDDHLWLVYDSASAAGKGVMSKVNAPDPYWLGRPSPGAVSPHAHTMEFHSSFESANLLRAVQRGPAEYDIFLRPDLHTHGHTQWFYFAVRNTHPPGATGELIVKFNVVNLTKPDSLFAMGMRPVLYSHHDAAEKGLGWRRCGQDIDYQRNGYSWYKPDGSQASFYTLSLSVTFPNPEDTYRIAHAHPYSYSDHKRHLARLLANEHTARYLNHTVICRTLGGNECDLLTVTDDEETAITATGDGRSITSANLPPSFGQGPQNGVNVADNRSEGEPGVPALAGSAMEVDVEACREEEETNCGGGARRGNKRCVVISARVHPGETPASWMMRGMLDFITGESVEARLLRSLFVFKIVPMLNPDGVAFGNNRCSLAGVDLNRQWKRPSRTLHPTVFWLKQHIRQEQGRKGVAMYIDLHGHSRKMNIFMYGADEKRRGVSCPSARVFPKLLSWNRLGRKYVSFKECSFAVKKGRESTARVVVARDLGIGNSYTVESTFCGVDFGPLKDHHLNTDHLQEAGVAICDALLDYYLPNQAQRQHATRDLLTRDCVEEVVGISLGIASTTVTVAIGSAVSPGGENGEANGGGGGVDGEGSGQDGEGRDDDDDVVDNNDDLESEDDNDSEAPEASLEEVDVDQDADLNILSSLPVTPPDFDDTPPGLTTRDEASGISTLQRPAVLVSSCPGRRIDGNADITATAGDEALSYSVVGGADGEKNSAGGWSLERTTGGCSADCRVIADCGEGGDNNPWPGIDWGEGETGRSGGARRWGRVIDEADCDGTVGGGSGEEDRETVLEFPDENYREQRELVAQSSAREGKRIVGRGKKECRSGSRDRGNGGMSGGEETASRALGASSRTGTSATAREPSPLGIKKERRRMSGSRAPKMLALSNGIRGKGSDRIIGTRHQRPRAYGISGDGAARRASDAALQAASNVLAACSGSNPTSKSRHRVRSLVGSGASNSGRFTPENASGGSSSRSSGSGASNRGTNGGSSGRGRGRGGSGGNPGTRVLVGSSAAEDLESAPRSGSSLDVLDGGTGEPVTGGVVKRGGNPRWLSPTDPTTAGGLEGNWGGMGSLPPKLARRLSPTQSSFIERSNSESRARQAEFGAPEIGNDATRGIGAGGSNGISGGNSSGSVKGLKGGVGSGSGGAGGIRGRVGKARGVAGGGERGDTSTVTTAMLALPALDDGSGGGGLGARGAGGRQEHWTGGESAPSLGLFASSRVLIAAREQS